MRRKDAGRGRECGVMELHVLVLLEDGDVVLFDERLMLSWCCGGGTG
jgi:hypothetical protein